jgi:hypothetical protein
VNRVLKYGAILIGTYLVVAHATGAGILLNGAGGQTVAVTRALQGR